MQSMTHRCPICDRPVQYEKGKRLSRFFPFCSERCKLVDLGRWLGGEYTISRPLTPAELAEEVEKQQIQGDEGQGET